MSKGSLREEHAKARKPLTTRQFMEVVKYEVEANNPEFDMRCIRLKHYFIR